MKTKPILLALVIVGIESASLFAQGTAFTYQGRLNDAAELASGNYDFRLRLAADALGNTYVGSTVFTNGVPVSNGLFRITLDFGANFSGADRWLEVGVRTNGSPDPFTTLLPRQAITPSPYAIFSATAGSVSNGVIQNPLFLGTTGNRALEFF